MNRWDDQFQKHEIHDTLKEASDLISTEFDDISSEKQSEKRRILKVVSAYQNTLLQLDPELVPYNVLDDLNSEICSKGIWDELNKYSSEGDYQHLINANDEITSNLGQLSQLLAIAKKSVAEKPIKGLEKSLDAFAKAIDTKKVALEKDIESIDLTVKTQQGKLEELSDNITTNKQETNTLITSWQDQHSNAQHKRADDFSAWQKEIEAETKTSVDSLIDKRSKKLEESQTSFNEKISTYITKAKDKYAAILNLYEIVAGGYKKNADDEKDAVNFWRWGAIIFIILTAGWTGFSYVTGSTTSADGSLLIGQIIKAFSVTGVLSFGAVYSAKQSNGHRENEKRTRWFALEVNAIDPFIASLNEDDRKALKNKLCEKLFGQQEIGTDAEKVIDEHAYRVLVKGIIDILKAK